VEETMPETKLSRRFMVRIIATGGLLVGGLLVIAAISLWGSYKQDRLTSRRAVQTSAQLLEQALTRSFESTEVALTAVSRRITAFAKEREINARGPIPYDPEFAASVSGLLRFAPHIRQLLVVDSDGVILVDSAHTSLGRLDLSRLGFQRDGPHAVGGGLRLGTPVAGRFLADPEPESTQTGLSILPVILPFRSDEKTTLYAIAALNSGFFREAFDAVVASDRASTADQVVMTRYDGQILIYQTAGERRRARDVRKASSMWGPAQVPPAVALALTTVDGGSLQTEMPYAADLAPEFREGTVQWRVSSRYPVVILIGVSNQTVLKNWLQGQRDILIGVPLVLLVLVALIWGLLRQVLARSALQDRVRVLSQAIQQGPATVLITNAQGQIEYANQAFQSLFGYENHEVIGQTPAILKSGMMC
jgi:PAS domain-containing protein